MKCACVFKLLLSAACVINVINVINAATAQELSVSLPWFHWSPSQWNEVFRGNFVCKYLNKLSFWPEYFNKYKPFWNRRKWLAGYKLCKGEVRPSHSIHLWYLKWKDNLVHLRLDRNDDIKRHLEEMKWAVCVITLSQGRDQWRELVVPVMNI